jgi:hypothetical protein
LVRFQLPELQTEAIRPDEEPVLKTGGGAAACEFESHRFRLETLGSSSNRKTPAPHAGDPSAILGESTECAVPWSNGTTSGPHPENDGSTPSGTTVAQVRQLAERHGLNPRGCRFESGPRHCSIRLGRQLADHPRLERRMLWVRVPPGPLQKILSSWSSLECSPPCQGGDHGFKSRRGRF